MSLVRLIYHSKSTNQLSATDIAKLQQQAIDFNKKNDITGVLVHDGKRFLQLLEGDKNIINDLYVRIVNDSRHTQVSLIYYDDLDGCRFTEWSMGVAYMPVSQKTIVESKYGGFFPHMFKANEAMQYLCKVREFTAEYMNRDGA